MLFNDDTGNYLKVTGNEIVYRHSTTSNDYNKEFNEFKERVTKVIIPLIIEKYQINNFLRVGMVFLNDIENKDKYSKIVNNVSKIADVNDIRFSKKDTTQKGKLFKNYNDYTNKIYTLSINTEDIPTVIYDYQYFYNPARRIFKECEIEKIINSAYKNVKEDLINLLGENNGKK